MSMRRLAVLFLLFQLLVVCGQEWSESDTIPVDEHVRTGVLPNGMRYYLRDNEKPDNRVAMRLVVQVGSVQEEEHEQGLAHFVEHMAFNGTENFEKSQLVDFLEKSGIKFGPELNAYTSFVNTVYMLQVPADDQGLLDTAFMVLYEWAGRLAMEEEEIDKERGVVIEEWRVGLGARDRMWRQTSPCILKDSRYAERLPIGKVDVVREASYETIRTFYDTWYRPDLMAVIVVGDIHLDSLEERILSQFSSLGNPDEAADRISYTIPPQDTPSVCIASDREATYNLVSLYYDKQALYPVKTIGDYKNQVLLPTLFTAIFNERYDQIKEEQAAPFVYFSSYYGDFYQAPVSVFAMNVVVKDTLFTRAAQKIFEENERILRHGVALSELERAKSKVLKAYEKALREKDKQQSGSFADEYVRNFVQGESIPGIDNEYKIVQSLMPGITLEDINATSKRLLSDTGLVITIQTSDETRDHVPSPDELIQQYRQVKKQDLDTLFEQEIPEKLIGEAMSPSLDLVEKKFDKQHGYTRYHFSNGLKLIAKPTDFKNDELLFEAISPGGHSVFEDSLYMAARYLGTYLNRAGVADYSHITLERMLAGKDVSMTLRMGEVTEEFSGHASGDDLELMFQLFYLYFTDYREDEQALQNLIRDEIVRYERIRQDPQAAFYDSLLQVASQHDRRRYQYPSVEQLEKIKLDDVLKVMQSKTENILDYTFVVVGNYDETTLLQYFSTYVGAIQPGVIKEKWEDRMPVFPGGITRFTMEKGEAPKSQVVLMMKDTLSFSSYRNLQVKMLNEMLAIRLRKQIREELGGTYGVHVSLNLEAHPREQYSMLLAFGCEPDRAAFLIDSVMDELLQIKVQGFSDQELEKAREILIRQREIRMEKNNYWVRALSARCIFDHPLYTQDQYAELIRNIKPAVLLELVNRIVQEDHYVLGILMPENIGDE